ncbi:hypothetical protein [Fulvivirga lutimaris]|uniref:hypothetical protein n=1 Tax=Fulvivirga lutimaris TaxID=1819566 RepID=UPI0012BD8145|nr:hypothetical protein [Fulvivirga lutimaris]MTI39546.1 hypothetical protein [Fulvivirga lutimaris]
MDQNVQLLLQLRNTHELRVELAEGKKLGALLKVRFYIRTKYWDIYIDDEYSYFNVNQQLVCIYLVMDALEEYNEADDYLLWCKANRLNASDTEWLEYYKSLDKAFQEIELLIGKINSFINPLDYQLNAGSFHALLNYEANDQL